ncbi:MAG: endonuclease domain-containing protein [Petrimonas sp.]|nr:endonuclease domain-containing protein [Petrimonas sp.]
MRDKNRIYLKTYRRNLRRKMTAAEVALWKMLRNRQLDGVRFFRQYSIDNYILDFYCPQYHIAIELDGDVHFDELKIEQDDQRTNYLLRKGVRVLRFENFEVFQYPQRTLDEIRKYLYSNDNPENILISS